MQKSNESRSYVKYDNQWYSKPLDNVPNISLCDMLKRSARKYGNQIALTDSQGCNLTFSELDKYSDRFVSFLLNLKSKKMKYSVKGE